jgi:hypothetical protein
MLTDAEREKEVIAELRKQSKYARRFAMEHWDWLEETIVKRGGTHTDHWYDKDAAKGGAVLVGRNRKGEDPALCFGFTISAGGRGGGDTNIKVEIKPEHFPTLLLRMLFADREATLRAMADELFITETFPTLLRMMAKTDREATLRAMAEELRFQICGRTDNATETETPVAA